MTAARELAALEAAVATLAPASLADVLAQADLQSRTERKYLVRPWVLEAIVDGLRDDYRSLDIDGRRLFGYESVYFDTPDLASYLAAAHGRRRRFKVRTRTYVDSGLCVLEVKTKGGRGETVKVRVPHDPAHKTTLDSAAAAFVADHVAPVHGHLPAPSVGPLTPTLTTTYSRATLADLEADARVTCDADLALHEPSGRSVRLSGVVLIETKSASRGPADRILWRLGQRPVAVSKYCVGLAALHPGLPSNRWHRTLQRHFAA